MSLQDLFGEDVQDLDDGDSKKALRSLMKPGVVVGLYFSAHWCPPCKAFTPQLAAWYNQFKSTSPNRENFEVIFVTSDRDEESFKNYYSTMPWLALPYGKSSVKKKLTEKFKVSGIPSLMLIEGDTGKLITNDGRSIVHDDPDGLEFPWAPKPFSELMDIQLMGKDGDKVSYHDINEDVIGFYFSAHWCGPCQVFTPELVKTYTSIRNGGKSFEIIFVSSDENEESMLEYFKSMPWLAMTHGITQKKALTHLFGVSAVPCLVLVKKDGEVIMKRGREAVSEDPTGQDFPWKQPVNPLLSYTAPDLNDKPSLIVFVENAEDSQKAKELLTPIAKDHFSGGKHDFCFFYNDPDKDEIPESLRAFAKVQDKTSLILIDIPAQKVYEWGGFPDASKVEEVMKCYIEDKERLVDVSRSLR